MLDKITDINPSINKNTTEIKETEMRAAEFENKNSNKSFINNAFKK